MSRSSMHDMTPVPVAPVSTRTLIIAIAASAAVAAIVLAAFVLPAEFGRDPLGTGRALGLTALAGGAAAPIVPMAAAPGGPLKAHSEAPMQDTAVFSLLPYVGFVEYHYRLPENAVMVYDWKASGKVAFDFHTQPDGKPPEASESFEKGESAEGHGSFTAPYSGLHGWYWENRTDQVVRITVTTTGFYSAAIEYRDDGTSVEHALQRGGDAVSRSVSVK